MLTPIRFGTDGWRAIIADEFTFANLDRVAQATADGAPDTTWNPPANGSLNRMLLRPEGLYVVGGAGTVSYLAARALAVTGGATRSRSGR